MRRRTFTGLNNYRLRTRGINVVWKGILKSFFCQCFLFASGTITDTTLHFQDLYEIHVQRAT